MQHNNTFKKNSSATKAKAKNNQTTNNLLQEYLLPVILILLFSILLTQNIFSQCTLACNNQINLSLPNDCEAEVTYDMMLQDANNASVCTPTGSGAYFIITVMDASGFGVLPTSPVVTSAEVGQLLNVKVKHWASGNLCWGTILVEDKLAPNLSCPTNTTVQCTESTNGSNVGVPTVTDCSDFELTSYDQTVNLGCSDPMSQITRTYIATDENGFSSSCAQIISIANPDISSVQFPQNYDNNELPAISCHLYANNTALSEPENTGFPTINGLPIVPGSNPCGINIGYTDSTLDMCDGTFKILRSWTVLEWCTSTIVNDLQVIKIADSEGPIVSCLPIINAGTTSGTSCTASVLLPAATISDLCSSIDQVSIYSVFGTISGNGGVLNNIPIGTHTITYQATDNCGNTTPCTSTLTVTDDDSPTVVCDEFTTVTLNSSGVAYVNAITFDDGSHDNCCLDEFSVRRLTAGCDSDATFSSQIKFCCEDIGQNVQVEMQVTDCHGLANSCIVQVSVSENSNPSITCPANITIECTQDYLDLAITGQPTAADACGFIAPTYSDAINLGTCGLGTITRTWYVTDNQGNANNCSQSITIEDNTSYTVNFPPDYTAGACTSPSDLDAEDLPAPYNAPTYTGTNCELLAVSHTDAFFAVAPPACFKIIRTWKVIDWCTYDLSNPNGAGQYTAQQIIVVMDNEAPLISCPANSIIPTNSSECTATVTFPQPTVTDCSDDITIAISHNLGVGFGPFTNVLPGDYTANYFVSDGCGNVSNCTTTVTVDEQGAPTPYCVGGLILELSPIDVDGDGIPEDGEIDIWASDFDAGSFDNCGGSVMLSLSSDTDDVTEIFTCADFGFNIVELWVTDEDGNQDYCQTSVLIESVSNVCGNEDGIFIIAGAIADEAGNLFENAMISVNDGVTTPYMTNQAGEYSFENMAAGGDYTVSPSQVEEPLNGVTTWDLVMIRRHILGDVIFDSPYKYIAADVNKSQSVTTSDIVELRKMILHFYDDFPNNTAWRFVDAAYVFDAPNAPLQEGFPEIYSINNLSSDMTNLDFVAVKVGDLNGTAVVNGLMSDEGEERTDNSLDFVLEDKTLEAGVQYSIPVSAESAKNLMSAQFTLIFNVDLIDFENVENIENSRLVESDFYQGKKQEGFITGAWYHIDALEYSSEETLFYLNFKAKTATTLSEVFKINSSKTKALAFDERGTILGVQLLFNASLSNNKQAVLYQNQPNPFASQTVIRFDLPKAEKVKLEILDWTGKLVFTVEKEFAEGRNEVRIDENNLSTSGIYYYRLETTDELLMNKMVLTN